MNVMSYLSTMRILATISMVYVGWANVEGFELTVLHTNDIHSRIEQTNTYLGVCKKEDVEKKPPACFGGMARLVSTVNKIEQNDENVIFLNGGDMFQGNVWYSQFKWKIIAQFTNYLNFTASSPGNHEFDDKIAGFRPFVKNITYPMICANCDFGAYPELNNLIKPYITKDVGGKTIGIIGFITTDTNEISNPEKVKFLDEILSIQKAATELRDSGVTIIIAVGHSGYGVDMKIAKEVPEIDLVVGGHTHLFLYTGDPPSKETPAGDYPTLITQDGGKVVPVVQAFWGSKYLGYMKLNFSEDGEMTSWDNTWNGKKTPILLDGSHEQDPWILEKIKPWKQKLIALDNQIIGSTNVVLHITRHAEANLGDFVADSMVDAYADNWPSELYPNKPLIAIINSGGIRNSLDVGDISFSSMKGTIPFGNTIDIVTLKGGNLKAVLEFSAIKLALTKGGGFLQVSGIQMTINMQRPENDRITDLKVRCEKDCTNVTYINGNSYESVVIEKDYPIVATSYLLGQGDGYQILKESYDKRTRYEGPLDTDVFQKYLKKHTPVTQEVDHRITIINKYNDTATVNDTTERSAGYKLHPQSFWFLLLLIFLTLLN